MFSIYIHVPFCYNKCDYCSFFMIPLDNHNNTNLIDSYTNSIIDELSRYAGVFDDKEVKTIHFG